MASLRIQEPAAGVAVVAVAAVVAAVAVVAIVAAVLLQLLSMVVQFNSIQACLDWSLLRTVVVLLLLSVV